MLSAIFGKKSDHPLADLKSVQNFLENLPKNDAHKSLTELTDLIEMVSGQDEFKLDHQFAVLRMLDEAAQPFVRKLAREYFTPFEIGKFQENRLWLVLENFSRLSANAYFSVFSGFCNADKGSNTLKMHIPLLTSRAVHALTCQLKYISTRYGKVDHEIWAKLAQLYKHAEQLQYLDTPIRLYSVMVGNTSVKCESGSLLVWYDCGLSAMSPLHIHLTERLIAQYCSTIQIHGEVSGAVRLSFDLNNPVEPGRINMDATTHPAMRFLALPTMQAKLEDLMKVLKKNIVPDDINLGGNYDAEVIIEPLQHLLTYLIAPPVRRNARHTANVTLNIVNGFDEVFERSNSLLSIGEEPAHWLTQEISVGGFSSILPPKSEGIGIGSLLGIQPDGVSHWGVAVVRRLLRDEENLLHAGAEILSNRVTAVNLIQSGGQFGDGQKVLWLDAKQDEQTSGMQLLLMKADTFSSTQSLKIKLDDKNYLLIPTGLQERGLDYDLAKFKSIVQEVDPAEIH